MSSLGTAIGLSAGLCAIAVASYATAVMTRSGSLTPNGLMGIRTRATRRSERSWFAGHEAARPALLTTAVVSLCGAVTTTLAGVAPAPQDLGEDVVVALGLSTYAVAVALLVYAGFRADRAARSVQEP